MPHTATHKIIVKEYTSPVGTLILGSYGNKLCMCDWAESRQHGRILRRLHRLLAPTIEYGTSAALEKAENTLREYFAGRRRTFDTPILLAGTDFQLKVWHALTQLPFGQTTSYAALARSIDMPRATRAVANAVGANPISIIVPCHRVIGSDNTLTGYAGGLAVKTALLKLEST